MRTTSTRFFRVGSSQGPPQNRTPSSKTLAQTPTLRITARYSTTARPGRGATTPGGHLRTAPLALGKGRCIFLPVELEPFDEGVVGVQLRCVRMLRHAPARPLLHHLLPQFRHHWPEASFFVILRNDASVTDRCLAEIAGCEERFDIGRGRSLHTTAGLQARTSRWGRSSAERGLFQKRKEWQLSRGKNMTRRARPRRLNHRTLENVRVRKRAATMPMVPGICSSAPSSGDHRNGEGWTVKHRANQLVASRET